jgi:hypothetical protein
VGGGEEKGKEREEEEEEGGGEEGGRECEAGASSVQYTDKKENKFFIIYKEIRKGPWLQSHK